MSSWTQKIVLHKKVRARLFDIQQLYLDTEGKKLSLNGVINTTLAKYFGMPEPPSRLYAGELKIWDSRDIKAKIPRYIFEEVVKFMMRMENNGAKISFSYAVNVIIADFCGLSPEELPKPRTPRSHPSKIQMVMEKYEQPIVRETRLIRDLTIFWKKTKNKIKH